MRLHGLLLPLLILGLAGDTFQTQAKKNDVRYKLVFRDEFNLPDGSQPDSTIWSRCQRYGSTWNRWISTSKDVVFIKNGKLVCRAIPNITEKNDTAKMLTGAIETVKKFSFQYGKVDVKLKTNAIRGNFPAAWMKPETINPMQYGEIDIFESFGDMGVAQQTIHNQISVTSKRKVEKMEFRTTIQVNEWHVYSVEWTPTKLTFLVDNKITGVFYKSKDKLLLNQGQWTFDRPFYLILNQSVGDGKSDNLRVSTNHSYETQFDWVRVYKII